MSNTLKGFTAAILIFLFFCLMSRMDYIVHGILYRYGLQFSYEWANEYWAIYTSLFVFCSIAMALMYWLGSNKTSKDLKISIGLFATINILMIGGLQDLLFYTLWGNGLPPDNVVWWWTPMSHYFGMWNSSMQVALTAFTCFATVPLWLCILKNKARVAGLSLKSNHRSEGEEQRVSVCGTWELLNDRGGTGQKALLMVPAERNMLPAVDFAENDR